MTRSTYGKCRVLKGRAQEAFDYICVYAEENSGATPTTRMIADTLHMRNFQQAAYLLLQLSDMGLIEYVSRYQYKVNNSYWTPPDTV